MLTNRASHTSPLGRTEIKRQWEASHLFFYHFGNEIDLAFRDFVSKPFVDDEQVNPPEPCEEPFLLLWRLQTFKILNKIRHSVEKRLLSMSAGYVS